MYKFKTLVVIFLLLIVGCTNITSDVARTIHPAPSSSSLQASKLFSAASGFFTEAGYQCNAYHDPSALRCAKELRDLYIHQTQAVVEIYPRDETYPHTLVTSRWDEGLIPGEFISSEFTNPDVKAFCEYLQAQGLGSCRMIK